MAHRSGLEFVESDSDYDVVEGLTTWEFINPSDSDDDVDFTFPSSSDDDVGDVMVPQTDTDPVLTGTQTSDMCMRSLDYLLTLVEEDRGGDDFVGPKEGGPVIDTIGPLNCLVALEDQDYDEDGSDDEYYDEHDLDDELVPRSVRGKFGKERIKKLGKRGGCPRMKNSKKLPHYYNRPGCVHGKHGLGVQHSYI